MSYKEINLWDNVPGYIDGEEKPILKYYPAENKRGTGTVIIFAGGGYMRRSPHEGEGYAVFLNSIGLDAFVLEYRVSPYRHPMPLLDARRAVRVVRDLADELQIDKDKIAVMGSSAGGHLAAHVSTFRGNIDEEIGHDLSDVSPYPNMQILCYPVTDNTSHGGSYLNLLGDRCSELEETVNPIKLVSPETAPAFIWHTETDPGVSASSTMRYAAALHDAGVRVEMHIYPVGGHGLGLAKSLPYIARWSEELSRYLVMMGYMDESV